MSIKSCEKTEKNTYELKLAADAAQFEEAVAKAYAKTKGKYNVPGFRRGKAPRKFIEKLYGENAFYEDALEILYPSLYEDAVKESKIKPVDSPYDLDVPEIGKDGIVITMKVTVEPEVEVKKYKGLESEKEEVKVSADEVNAEIDRILEQNARTVTVEDRAVQSGDTAVIDFEGFDNGVAFENGKGENYSLEIGSNSFIPGFEDQLIGHKTGEEFDINVTFPKEYDEKLAGKDVVFKIKLHEIKVKELPALDDEFVKDVSEFDTVDEYKKDLKNQLHDRKEKNAQDAFEAGVVDALCANTEAEIPEVMIEKAIDENVGDFEYRLQMQGVNLDVYLSYLGMDKAKFREQYRENSEKQVRFRLALQKIAELEKLEATEDEKNEEIEKYAKAYGMDAEKIKSVIPVSDLEGDIVRRKSMDFVIKNAVSVKAEKKAAKKSEDDAAEKKPAAKKTAKKTAEAKDADAAPAKKPAAKKTTAKTADKAEAAEKKPAAKKTAKKEDK